MGSKLRECCEQVYARSGIEQQEQNSPNQETTFQPTPVSESEQKLILTYLILSYRNIDLTCFISENITLDLDFYFTSANGAAAALASVLPDIFQKIALLPNVRCRHCRRRNAGLIDPAAIDVVGVEIAVKGGPTVLNSPNYQKSSESSPAGRVPQFLQLCCGGS